MKAPTWIIGVDEAGRGPLAGPVAVGVVRVAEGFDVAREFLGVKDSKQLSEPAREKLFALLEARAKQGDLAYRVCLGGHAQIDQLGITSASRHALARGIRALTSTMQKSDFYIQLDGGLYAPKEFSQETIIRGDDLVPLISLASIAAKVTRDRLMTRMAAQYPAYGFERHKGYPTRAHYEALRRWGPCAIHRRSYLHLPEAVVG
ncbi:MAG: ribonuclease HII [Patescibacteria group bacterium]|nr:ribonuclease HII [Patescibacteria group bacterium]MDE1943968.1 ribonuclease HII [Patescibacteria group bacterium]MDE1944897.1 ribonuclease HII [Patescibacteria group bacterium]MDE2057328.1 ribonuclease HII [Patescibacteria group bacterium]